jgi:hypothetical protein
MVTETVTVSWTPRVRRSPGILVGGGGREVGFVRGVPGGIE